MYNRRGFFEKLFDFSFSEFIAIQIIGIIYALGLLLAGFLAFGILTGGLGIGGWVAITAFIVAPLAFLLYAVGVRMVLEALVASIRTAENTKHIAVNTREMVELMAELLRKQNESPEDVV